MLNTDSLTDARGYQSTRGSSSCSCPAVAVDLGISFPPPSLLFLPASLASLPSFLPPLLSAVVNLLDSSIVSVQSD